MDTTTPPPAPPVKKTLEQKLFDALNRISKYESVTRVKIFGRNCGLGEDEAVESAYENVIAEARHAIKGMRRPK